MVMEKISVIIPCYNAEAYIDRCLGGMEGQTYGIGNLELILVNDASTDDTYEHLLEFEKKYPENVIIISCEKNAGPGAARNIGMEYASGNYVAFVDADDAVDVTMFSKMYEAVKKHEPDIVECAYRVFSGNDKPSADIQGEDYFIRIDTDEEKGRFILNSLKTAVWARLYKKSFIDENALRFPENIIYGEDNYFSGLSMLLCGSYYHIGEALYYYYQNDNGIIHRNSDNGRIGQLAEVMKLYLQELDSRALLDGALAGYMNEFEWYMVYKYFMDPVSFVVSRKMPDWREWAHSFGKGLLEYFPQAYENIYLKSDIRWKDYIALLTEIAAG